MLRAAARNLARIGRSHELTWRYLFHFSPTLAYRLGRTRLSRPASLLLKQLNRDGIAVTSVDELLGPTSCFDELVDATNDLERRMSNVVADARASASRPQVASSRKKGYLVKLLGEKPPLDSNSAFVRFTLQKPILQVVNAYYGMYACLRAFNIWHTFVSDRPPTSSQLWHRDLDDPYHTLKVFVYLTDVDEGAGPLIYATGSHRKGQRRGEPAFLYKDGNTPRSDDGQMAKVVPPTHWKKCTGPKGTIVFADTRGYHKGGDARERERLLYVSMFTSRLAAVAQGNYFERCGELSCAMDKDQTFALRI